MSERTAMRTLPNLAVRRSPWPSLARPGIAREVAGASPRAVATMSRWSSRPGDGHLVDLERPAAEGLDRPLRGGQLAGELAAFPGDEDPAGGEQRKGQLDELGERATARAVTAGQRPRWRRSSGEGFGPDGGRLDRAGQPGGARAADRKAAFLATGSRSRARAAGSAAASGIPG